MGTYGLNAEEIADAMEKAEVESHCEGDFYEETFIEGAKIYVDRLRERGAYIYTEKKKEIKEFIKKIQ
jgi:predicted cupin superfamily sugar epimerase